MASSIQDCQEMIRKAGVQLVVGYILPSSQFFWIRLQFGPVTNGELIKVKESITWQFEFPGGAICNSTSAYNSKIDRVPAPQHLMQSN